MSVLAVCPAGTFGSGCSGTCHCLEPSACNATNGQCSGKCEKGYYLPPACVTGALLPFTVLPPLTFLSLWIYKVYNAAKLSGFVCGIYLFDCFTFSKHIYLFQAHARTGKVCDRKYNDRLNVHYRQHHAWDKDLAKSRSQPLVVVCDFNSSFIVRLSNFFCVC